MGVTVFLTAGATILQTRAIQRFHLSQTVPYLSFIPVFMLPWTFFLLHELPSRVTLLGIVCICYGAWLLNGSSSGSVWQPIRALSTNQGARLVFIVACTFGLTTTCDALAIRAASAWTYTFLWTACSTFVMGGFLVRVPIGALMKALRSPGIYIQALFWTGGFFLQMKAVQEARDIAAGAASVKALTMISVIITVSLGGFLFVEQGRLRSFIASTIMVVGAVVIMLSR